MFKKITIGIVSVMLLSLAIGFITNDNFVYAKDDVSNKNDSNKNVWVLRCEKGTDYCEVFQRLDVAKTKQRLLEVAIGFPKDALNKGEGNARAVMILPLGVLLKDGVTVSVEGQSDINSPITTCTEGGCFSTVLFNKDFVTAMKKADSMTIKLRDRTGKPVNIVMSLKGFSAVLNKL